MVSGFDTSTWSNINVPAMWQMEGFAKPQYLNSNYGIPVDAPNGKVALAKQPRRKI